MSNLIYTREHEDKYPHAADVLERDYAENGFSKGWALHCKPAPEYFFDCHVHYGDKKESVSKSVSLFKEQIANKGVKRALIILQIYGKKWAPALTDQSIMDDFPYFTANELKDNLDLFEKSGNIFWSAYINCLSPEKELVHAAADMGARCIKLHNAPQIEENSPLDLWYSSDWRDCFEAMAERKLPVLWHVTQRLPSSVYTGGGRNAYWIKGWKNGVTYTNEDLLQVFLTCCRRNPGVNFIGAHQLHIGWERLDELFTAHHNLYVDSTIGCMLREYDDFYPQDKEFLRSVFIKWSDRILFGTDSVILDSFNSYGESVYAQHIRFITSLDLPQDVLNKITHGNLERLCNIAKL